MRQRPPSRQRGRRACLQARSARDGSPQGRDATALVVERESAAQFTTARSARHACHQACKRPTRPADTSVACSVCRSRSYVPATMGLFEWELLMTTVELVGIGLALTGIGVSVYYGVKAVKTRKSQKQSVTKGAIGIQSGRDTRIER